MQPDPTIIPKLGDPRCLRHVGLAGYRLLLWDCYERMEPHGHSRCGYALWHPDGSLLFAGTDYGVSSFSVIDDDEAVRGILSFLTLRPGDTDPDYFDHYTPDQLAWAESEAEELQLYTVDPEDEDEPVPWTDLPPLEDWGREPQRDRHASEREAVGSMMCQWHAGGGDPIYAVGSYFLSGKPYPSRKVVEQALSGIERLADGADEADRNELDAIAAYLKQALTNDYPPASKAG